MLHRARTRTRVIAVIGAIAVGGATFLAVNPSAGAAVQPHFVGGIESSPNPTTVTPGATAPQAAGDWITTSLGAVEPASSTDAFGLLITLDDTVTTPGPLPILTPPTTSCKALSQAVSFASTPTVTNLTPAGQPGGAARFAATLQRTSFCNGPGINDQLFVFATVGDAAGAKLKISGITYKVGAGVGVGPIPYKVATTAGNDAFTTVASNAVVTQVTAESSAWQTLLPPGHTSTIPSFTIKETAKGAIPTGGVCVALVHPPTLAKFDTTSPPSVAATGGTGAGVPGAVTMSGDGLSFGFTTTVSTVATTYTVRNLKLVSTAPNAPAKSDLGPIDVDIKGGPCATPGALLAPGVRLGTVGFVQRLAGDNRYATAATLAVREGTFPGKTVVIARGDNFPDALAASYLAGQNHVPILLTRATSLPIETQAALAGIGATDVVIVGGPSAVTPDVENALKALPVYDASQSQEHPVQTNAKLTVSRVGGVDRYDTAKLVAERPGVDSGGTLGLRANNACTPQATAILASGENFPDALAAGGLAFHGAAEGGCGSGPIPLLLTAPGALSAATAQAMADLKIKVVLLVGGPNAVSTNVESVITNAGLIVKRIAGDTRQDTAVMLNHDIIGNKDVANWASGDFLATRPDTFPDALTASSLSGGTLSPLYLLGSGDEIGDTVQDGIFAYPTPSYGAFIIGGPAAVSANVETALAVLLASQPG